MVGSACLHPLALWHAIASGLGAGLGGGAQCGRDGLGDGELADEVDLQLAAELGQRHVFKWCRQGRPGVVDQAVQRAGDAHPRAGARHGLLVGEVKRSAVTRPGVGGVQAGRVLLAADAGPHQGAL